MMNEGGDKGRGKNMVIHDQWLYMTMFRASAMESP